MIEVILLSGGVESSTLLAQQRDINTVIPLFIDYGQRAAARELLSAKVQSNSAKTQLVVLDLSKLGREFRTRQTRKLHVPLPHRNLVLLSVAFSFATQVHAQRLSLALNKEDTNEYPGATTQFVNHFRALAGGLEDLDIATPLIALTKTEIARLGKNLGIDFTHTYSCLLGYAQHCGSCPQCQKRRVAMQRAGIQEPPGFYRQT